MEDRGILQEAITLYGEDSQTDMIIEEMAELTKALLKFRRDGGLSHSDVLDEIVDVQIMLDQIKIIHFILPEDFFNYEAHRKFKINRLKERLGL